MLWGRKDSITVKNLVLELGKKGIKSGFCHLLDGVNLGNHFETQFLHL